MNNCHPTFYAKLLLFGEYSILLGSSALSIPLKHFKASFNYTDNESSDSKTAAFSNQQLKKYHNFLKESGNYDGILDLTAFGNDLEKGLYFQSSIPQSYGLGSSGAVVAAVYSAYSIDKTTEKEKLCSIFSDMEAWFHGKSSGIDPLTIFVNQPLIFDKNKKPGAVEIPVNENQDNVAIFLIDTDIQGKTNIMVRNFMEKFAPEGNISAKAIEFVKLTDMCIDFYIKGNSSQFMQTLKSLSEFQFENMQQLIPENIKETWLLGLDNNKLIMKICGSGGGGYLLGFANNKNQAIEFLKNMHTGFIEVRFAKANSTKKQDITS